MCTDKITAPATMDKNDCVSSLSKLALRIGKVIPSISFDVALFIACQSALETSWFQSKICVENHNLFGMKMPSKRVTTAYKEHRGHACYYSYEHGIIDYLLWCQMVGIGQVALRKLDQFILKLAESNYCPRPTYVQTIISIFNKYFPTKSINHE